MKKETVTKNKHLMAVLRTVQTQSGNRFTRKINLEQTREQNKESCLSQTMGTYKE